ncbi:MAG: hypothetical protein H6658_07740 [Ardenticatenaceae bacterium]|nr:hypothetical protein [Ardenticatenaceae bacterium]
MDENSSWIKNGRAMGWLLVLIVGVGTGYTMLKEAVEERPFDNPPWLAIGVIFITIVALLLSQQESNESQAVPKLQMRYLPRWAQRYLGLADRYGRLLTITLAVVLVIFVLYSIPNMVLPDNQFDGLLLTWIAAFVLYLVALIPPLSSWNWPDGQWWEAHKWHITAATGLTLSALTLRVWRLETLPFTLAGDEGSQGLEAIRVLEGQIRNPFATGWLGVPT